MRKASKFVIRHSAVVRGGPLLTLTRTYTTYDDLLSSLVRRTYSLRRPRPANWPVRSTSAPESESEELGSLGKIKRGLRREWRREVFDEATYLVCGGDNMDWGLWSCPRLELEASRCCFIVQCYVSAFGGCFGGRLVGRLLLLFLQVSPIPAFPTPYAAPVGFALSRYKACLYGVGMFYCALLWAWKGNGG